MLVHVSLQTRSSDYSFTLFETLHYVDVETLIYLKWLEHKAHEYLTVGYFGMFDNFAHLNVPDLL